MTVSDTGVGPQGAPPPPGGPSWRRADGEQPPLPPTAFSSAPPGLYVGDTGAHGARSGTSEELFNVRYSRNGVSPLPFGLVALAAIAAAIWAVQRAEPTQLRGAVTSEWWINITAVLAPGEPIRLAAASDTRMWTAIGLLVFAALATALWIGRIGTNLRSGDGPFGSLLPLVALPAWWALPISLGLTDNAIRSRSDVLIRALLALAMLLGQFVLLRWPLLNRIWRAGHLRYDLVSIVLWLPMLVPWTMLYASTAFAIISTDDGERVTEAAWYPTETMQDWAFWLSRASGIAILVLLVVVSVRQHLGLAQDRAIDEAARAR